MKRILIIISLIALILIILGCIYILVKAPSTQTPTDITEQLNNDSRDITGEFNNDLSSAFQDSIDKMNLPEESVVMYDSYFGKEDKEISLDLESNGNKYFYVASSIKPMYVAAFINILEIKDLNYKIPFKFVDDEKQKSTIATELNDYLAYNRQIDSFITEYIAPHFVYRDDWTADEILEKFLYSPDMKNLEFNLADLIRSCLGPSSNLGISLLRSHLALNQNKTDEDAANAIEDYLNKFLIDQGKTGNLRIYMSKNSETDERYNSTSFYEIEYLHEYFWENKFKIEPTIWESMKTAMLNISADPTKDNRRHELKSIAKKVSKDNEQLKIFEKSGYIGLDYEATPGLNKLNSWDILKPVENKRIVIFNASSFSRIYFKNGEYLQFNYAIAVPTYISLDPHYEELNQEYLAVKNEILSSLESNLSPVFAKYIDSIQIVEDE